VLDLGLRSGVGSGVAVGVAGIGIGGRVERGVTVAVSVSSVDVVVRDGVSVGLAIGDGVVAGPLQAVRASRISINKDNQCNLGVSIMPPSLSE